MTTENIPQKNELAQRFELHFEGKTAVLEYRRQDSKTVIFTHTYVPPELRGRNLAAMLTHFALEDMRCNGLQVIPQCSYTVTYLARHQEFADLRAPAMTK